MAACSWITFRSASTPRWCTIRRTASAASVSLRGTRSVPSSGVGEARHFAPQRLAGSWLPNRCWWFSCSTTTSPATTARRGFGRRYVTTAGAASIENALGTKWQLERLLSSPRHGRKWPPADTLCRAETSQNHSSHQRRPRYLRPGGIRRDDTTMATQQWSGDYGRQNEKPTRTRPAQTRECLVFGVTVTVVGGIPIDLSRPGTRPCVWCGRARARP
jgi:hypothetical protein